MLDVLIVTWDRRRISAVQAAGFGESARLSACWSADWPEAVPTPLQNAAAAGEWLAGQWRTAGFTAKSTWLIVPREDVILRHLELPKVDDAELPDLVRFQAASRSAVPIEQLCLDFLPLSPHPARESRDVLSATLPKANVEAFATVLKAAERELAGVSVSSVALADWGAHVDRHRPRSGGGSGGATESGLFQGLLTGKPAAGGAPSAPTLIVAWDAPRLELAIVAGTELVFAHAARIGAESEADVTAAVLAEISRAVIAGQRLRPDLQIGQSWLVGTPRSVAGEVTERLGCPAEVIDPATLHAQRDVFRKLAAHPLEIALLLGGVWGRTAPVVPQLNFLKPRQPPAKRDPRKQQFAIGGAIALLVGFLVIGGSLAWISRLDAQIEELVRKQSDLTTTISEGQIPFNAANTIGEWSKRDVPQLAELLELESRMPGGQERPYLSEYNFATSSAGDALATLQAQGSAKGREQVEALLDDLGTNRKYRVKPSNITVGRDPNFPQNFTIDVDFLPVKKDPPAKGG
jgi:Tfp pilus assembly PilM family ATPase